MIRRLSAPIESIQERYDVVVVGSGYGGGIAASRLARAGRKVCVLERGKELHPTEYPDRGPEMLEHVQVDSPPFRTGSRTGLYDFRVNDEVNVFLGCGLGGTSLVNANVALKADPRVFDDPRWPQELRADVGVGLQKGYERAEEMLKPTPLPDHIQLNKLKALQDSAAQWPGAFRRVPINVTFEDHVNHVGVAQGACTLSGDCVSGCNFAAKNTVLMNYLPDAHNHGAEIFTKVEVRHIERGEAGWLVHYQTLETGREPFDAPLEFVAADIVVLAAGTLGSTEILLRSAARGLPLSGQVGQRFTGNGDVLAFSYNTERRIDGVGWGHRHKGLPVVGPCITGVIDLRPGRDLDDGMIIEEGSIPGGMGKILPGAFAAAAEAVGRNTEHGLVHRIKERERELVSLVEGPHHGAVRNTQTYLVMAHDGSDGVMSLENDRLRIHWPGIGDRPVFEEIQRNVEAASRPLGGVYLKDPLWSKQLGNGLVTVHPLGGCAMAEDADGGVVNHRGQVFSGPHGAGVYEDLYVCDGSVIPRSIGVNPLLTISALAERSIGLLAADRGWTIDYTLPSAPPPAPAKPAVGIEFTERMAGWFARGELDDYERGARTGEETGSSIAFVLTIVSEDVDRFVTEPEHEAHMAGTVEAPALSGKPLMATDGVFNLFVVDPDQPETRRMEYAMKLTTEEGRHYSFTGFKLIRHDRGLVDLWRDTTTLFATVHDGDSAESPVLGKGILRISPADFARQMTTMKATNASGITEALEAEARFGRFFAGVLYETYGGVFARTTYFDPSAPPRKKRTLRASAPELHPFTTDDGVELLLTRYRGGTKGPVVLAHGLGVSSRIFSTDLIDTNLLEFLFAHGYDVWLLDFRASIELPASRGRFTADDIAAHDYPAAVATIRAATGAETIQAVVHCYGATAFFMALLSGLEGVRTTVCSQIACHVVAPALTRVKSGLHLPEVVDALGVDSLTAYADRHEDWPSRLFDEMLKVNPVPRNEHCDSAVCHRITFLYSLLYEHAQLNEATHENLHELFGVANIESLEHLALMVRAGKIVRADGEDVYLPHADRLTMPITFIHGAENDCYHPKSTELTYDLLRQTNDPNLYRRHVVPAYGHIDCIYGKDAVVHTYPLILEALEAGNP